MPAFGLLRRREIWLPTVRGWVLILALAALLCAGAIWFIVPFLAPVRPYSRGILVVEGWVPDYTLEQAKATFETHPYRFLVVTGTPIDQGFFIAKETNYAYLARATLKALGLNEGAIVPIPCPEGRRDRTYATARAVRAWLDASSTTEPVDVMTLGVHARRTWLLYRLAMGKQHPTGIIAAPERRYDPRGWWRTSSGVRTVTSEFIAYLYARILFHPAGSAPPS